MDKVVNFSEQFLPAILDKNNMYAQIVARFKSSQELDYKLATEQKWGLHINE